MGRIRNVAVVGMGALGLLFGQRIRENLGDEHLLFLMDEARKKRHSLDEYRINGKAVSFRMASPGEMKGSFDLVIVATKYNALEKEGYVSGNSIPKISFPASESVFKKTYPYLKEADSLGLMDDPGTYSQPPHAGGSKDESGTAAKDTISIGSGDRVSGADRMGMEVH